MYLEDESFYQVRYSNPMGVEQRRLSCCEWGLLNVKRLSISPKVEVHSRSQIFVTTESPSPQLSTSFHGCQLGRVWSSLGLIMRIFTNFFKAKKSKFHIFIKQINRRTAVKPHKSQFRSFFKLWLSWTFLVLLKSFFSMKLWVEPSITLLWNQCLYLKCTSNIWPLCNRHIKFCTHVFFTFSSYTAGFGAVKPRGEVLTGTHKC